MQHQVLHAMCKKNEFLYECNAELIVFCFLLFLFDIIFVININ